MIRAYSYIRFSSERQTQGDSLRRQLALTRAWCEARGVELVEDYRDLGVSAFRGRNAVQGKLGGFLSAVESGEITRGSVLIVESLDRITRAGLSDAMPLFLRLINGGVTVVTLADAKEYKKETIDSNIGELMMSLVILSRANEESRMKSRRIGAAHKARRMRAAERGETGAAGNGPAWLRRDGDKWHVIPERAKAIKKLFVMVAKGYSLRVIGDALLADGMKPPRGSIWQTRSLKIILQSRAPIGELVMKGADERPVKIPNHFPAVVTVEQWKAANAHYFATRSRKPGRRNPRNIFSTLVEDEDGNPCHLATQTRENGRTYSYFLAFNRKDGHSKSTKWSLANLQSLVLAALETVARREVVNSPRSASESEETRRELVALEGRIANLAQAIADGYSATLSRALRDEEAKRDALEVRLQGLEIREGVAPVTFEPLPERDTVKLGARLRVMISRIRLGPKRFTVELRDGSAYVVKADEDGGFSVDAPDNFSGAD